MAMVHAKQMGKGKNSSPAVSKAAKSMTKKSAKDFASTKTKNLPTKKGKKKFATKSAVMSSLNKTMGKA